MHGHAGKELRGGIAHPNLITPQFANPGLGLRSRKDGCPEGPKGRGYAVASKRGQGACGGPPISLAT